MTLPTADLISEVLRLDEEAHTCDVGDLRPIVVRLADIVPELARRLRDAEEKLTRANEALERAGGEIKLTISALSMLGAECFNAGNALLIINDALASKEPGT